MEIIKIEGKIEHKDYIVRNFNKYGIRGIKSADDMIELLNILQAHDETLESFHGGHSEFCGIFGDMPDDNETYKALIEFNCFYRTLEEYLEIARENAEYDGLTIEEYTEYETLYQTEDGYVLFLEY